MKKIESTSKKAEHLQSFIDRFGAKATKASQANARKKALEKLPALEELASLEQLNFTFQDAPFSGQKVVECKNISFSYKENEPLIQNFSLEIMKGEKIAIIGKNGFGKSTLLKLIAKVYEPNEGEIIRQPACQIGYFGQTNIQKLDPALTVFEEIKKANSSLLEQQIKSICGSMMFSSNLMDKKISLLSGGEKSRVLIGTILAKPCNLILLDEPTHHLDMESIEALLEAIDQTQSAVLIVTHSEEILKRLPLDKVIFCDKNAQVPFLGDYTQFLEKFGNKLFEEVLPKEKVKKTNSQESYFESKNLLSEMKKVEKKIMQLEESIVVIDEEMVQLANKNKPVPQDLIKKQILIKKEIDDLFSKLEELDLKYNSLRF